MEDGAFKLCPFCKEQIRKEAIKCRFCGEWFEQTEPDSASKLTTPKPVLPPPIPPQLERTLLKTGDWESIENQLCLVKDFIPLAGVVRNGQVVSSTSDMPYASVRLRCCGSTDELTGFITHKIDFAMLWAAFNERIGVRETRFQVHFPAEFSRNGLGADEEIWLLWTRTKYAGPARLFSKILPHLIVMVSRKGFFELACESGEQEPPALVTWMPTLMSRTKPPRIGP
jgi:hypothetical protein